MAAFSQNCTVFIPGKGDGTTQVSVIVLYPGIAVGGAIGKEYMPPLINKAVPEWFNKYVIIIPNAHNSDWDKIELDYQKSIKAAGLIQKDLSIGCFSGAGNSNTSIQQKLTSLKPKNLFLMDPTSVGKIVENVRLLKAKGTSCYLMYNPSNWGKRYSAIAGGFEKLSEVVGENSINTGSRLNDHMKIPGRLLNQWKYQIERSLTAIGEIEKDQNIFAKADDEYLKENNVFKMKLNECGCGCGGNSNGCKNDRMPKSLNYMFFGNLKTIKGIVDEMMEMDESEVDSLLKNGHDWAVDHIASSMDDIQEVYNFIKNNVNGERNHNPFKEKEIFIKTFESYIKKPS